MPRQGRRRAAFIAGVGALVVAALTASFVVGRATVDPTSTAEYKAEVEKRNVTEAKLAEAEEQLGANSEEITSLTDELNDAEAQVDALVAELPATMAGGAPAVSEGVAIAPRNIKIGIKTREKTCFGSAGCNVTVQIDPDYAGNQDVSTGSWEITYEIRGGEDGPAIETMTLIDGTFTFPEEQFLSTSSSGARLEAVATEVYALE